MMTNEERKEFFLRSRYADKCRRLHNGEGPFPSLSPNVLLANEGNGTEKGTEEKIFILACMEMRRASLYSGQGLSGFLRIRPFPWPQFST